MSKATGTVFLFVLLMLTGCGQMKENAKTQETVAPQQGKTGVDRDAHGCIGSAGYRWCGRLDKCVRPWELADRERFDKTEEAFTKFCRPKQKEKQ